ncbi:MAG: hypothetical protein A2010_03130 [Nitrospirae bacterium GWD2_57_9]|nr:MAG: hypothetical protein A2010_03130 [Nitrospirae bacterium GWD2_57_9]OGW50577.1 MAG: hypothetical protein A2078_03225 [Nitrospirae bacterium GWC2_57_9]
MNTYKKTAISVAVLFLIALVFDIVASNIYQPILNAPDYLATVYPNKMPVKIGILFDLICAPAMILIPVLLFPLFKLFDERIALGYIVFRLLEGILFIFIAINSLSLISLSQDYLRPGTPDASCFQALGNSIHARIEWATLLYIIVFTLGALLFYSLLFRSKLIPRWLSAWGLFAALFLSTGALLHTFGMFGTMPLMKAMVFFAPPIGLQELVMSIWLIIKGFDPDAIGDNRV